MSGVIMRSERKAQAPKVWERLTWKQEKKKRLLQRYISESLEWPSKRYRYE